MKTFILTYLVAMVFTTLCFAQNIKTKGIKKTTPSKYAINTSVFQTPVLKNKSINTQGFEIGISKRINDESKKNRLSVGTDFGASFQTSIQESYYITPNIAYNINVWKNFYLKPRISVGTSITRGNTEYIMDETGSYKRLGNFKTQMTGTIGIEPNYNIYNSKKFTYNIFTRCELQSNTSISKLLPITMWHIGINVQPNTTN